MAFIPLLILAGVGTTLTARKTVHRAVVQAIVERGQSSLQSIAPQAAAGLQQAKESRLLRALTTLLDREGAIYAMVLDSKGIVAAHTDIIERGKTYADHTTVRALASEESTFQETLNAVHPFVDISWPVWDSEDGSSKTSDELLLLGVAGKERKRLGTLRIALPLAQAIATERRIARGLTALTVIVDCLLLGLVWLVLRRMLAPVRYLVQATEDISQGMYGALVPIPSAAELADFARSFNHMSETLAQTTVSKGFLDNVLENIRQPFIVLDPFGNVHLMNQSALQLTGYAALDVLGQSFERLWGEPGMPFLEGLETKAYQDKEVRLKSKTGEIIRVKFSAVPFKDQEEKEKGFIVVLSV